MEVTIANLAERISVIFFQTERNERGDVRKVSEVERCRVWARIYPSTAKISDAPPERDNKINYRVIIRHREDIKPDDEIIWRGRRLKLLSPPFPLDGKREFTAMDCEEVVQDGVT